VVFRVADCPKRRLVFQVRALGLAEQKHDDGTGEGLDPGLQLGLDPPRAKSPPVIQDDVVTLSSPRRTFRDEWDYSQAAIDRHHGDGLSQD